MAFDLITIDGQSAAGKSSVAEILKNKMGYATLSTGHFFRAAAASIALGGDWHLLCDTAIGWHNDGGSFMPTIGGEAVSMDKLSSDAVIRMVPQIAHLKSVRRYFKTVFRGICLVAKHTGYPGLVVDARDAGSYIFPESNYKFFLTADIDTRVGRRGGAESEESLLLRDVPGILKLPPGAVEIDTTDLTKVGVASMMIEHIEGL